MEMIQYILEQAGETASLNTGSKQQMIVASFLPSSGRLSLFEHVDPRDMPACFAHVVAEPVLAQSSTPRHCSIIKHGWGRQQH